MVNEYAVLLGGNGRWTVDTATGDLTDDEGERREWNNAAPALNELADEGWSLVTAGLVHEDGHPTTALYLVRKKRRPPTDELEDLGRTIAELKARLSSPKRP